MTSTALNIIGLLSNIIGTVILAFSLNNYIRSIRIAIDAHELYIRSSIHPNQHFVHVVGTDVHMNRDKKIASKCSWVGVFLVILGFLCQLSSYLFLDVMKN